MDRGVVPAEFGAICWGRTFDQALVRIMLTGSEREPMRRLRARRCEIRVVGMHVCVDSAADPTSAPAQRPSGGDIDLGAVTDKIVRRRRAIEPGAIIAGKYRVERLIGRGGMGCIVAARHLQLDDTVALKFLLAPDDRVQEFHQRFLREARVTAKLRSTHVARTLDFGVTDGGDPFIVMELLEGMTLRELLLRSAPLPVDQAVRYALQTCEGLAEAHRHQVVHRDLKPGNLFLTKDVFGSDQIKILDFGVAKLRNFAAAQSDLTAEGMLIGSPKYMAVEQLIHASEVDERADVWSLGAILYEMLVGRPPFAGAHSAAICLSIVRGDAPPSARDARPEIPEALDQAVFRCLARDLSRRTPDVAVLARELAEGSGMEGLEAEAKAVEDVLLGAARSLASTGQLRAFGQTGSYPPSSGGSSGPPVTVQSQELVREELERRKSARRKVAGLAAAGLVATVGALAMVAANRSVRDESRATETVPAENSSGAPTQASSRSEPPQDNDAEIESFPKEAGTDVAVETKAIRAKSPPQPSPRVGRSKRAPATAGSQTRKKDSPNPFESRY